MIDNEKILDSIYSAIEEINLQVRDELRLEKSPETTLFGQRGKLDSFGLVTLVVAIEQNIQKTFGRVITIADERAFSEKNSPFRTVSSLAEHISILIKESV
jgi:acyl carrier protein